MISEHEGYRADTIMIVIMTLAFLATMFEDLDAGSAHIEGLQQLVHLRGGRQFLMENPKTYFKIERYVSDLKNYNIHSQVQNRTLVVP